MNFFEDSAKKIFQVLHHVFFLELQEFAYENILLKISPKFFSRNASKTSFKNKSDFFYKKCSRKHLVVPARITTETHSRISLRVPSEIYPMILSGIQARLQ